MDKNNLYYIVIEGTSSRSTDGIGDPIIFMPDVVDSFVDKSNDAFARQDYVKISVEEYERIFTDIIEFGYPGGARI